MMEVQADIPCIFSGQERYHDGYEVNKSNSILLTSKLTTDSRKIPGYDDILKTLFEGPR